ncbi:hypothetical protein Cgig2_016528 [Carnegiea gigantea]|uniref:Uncharacterized protein n=1 Tax=Carnegiea gigantea TaxID=171969 RepID=A0A9Q1JYS7_9CARY|nr:hypothetical protein Cgig2_016528 [Carnegiea gigantea]
MRDGHSQNFSKKKASRKQANPRFCGPDEINNELCSLDDLKRYKSEDGSIRTGLTGFGSAPTTVSGLTHSEPTLCQPMILKLRNSGGGNDFSKAWNVLCDLFNMGEGCSQSFSKKKGSRKNANPRFCGPNEINNEFSVRTGLTGFGSAPTTASGWTHSERTQFQLMILELRNFGGRNDVSKACNVLCDLFNMGEGCSQSFSKKKGSHKQANPRFCGPNEINDELCS